MHDYTTATARQVILAPSEAMAKPIDRSTDVGDRLARSRKERGELGRTERRQQAQRRMRHRAALVAQIQAPTKIPAPPEPNRLAKAWRVVAPLNDLVERVAEAKGQKARYHLGLLPNDVAADCILELVTMLAKSDRDLDQLHDAARALNGEEVEVSASAQRFLRQAVHVIVRQYLLDAYRAAKACPEDAMTESVLAQMEALGQPWDHHDASRAPVMLGGHPTAPGSVDALTIAIVATVAITSRHLDPMVEFLLAHLRTDGSFSWTQYAREVFMLDPEGNGVVKWAIVCQATAHMADPVKGQASAARMFARSQFAFLTPLLAHAAERLDPTRS